MTSPCCLPCIVGAPPLATITITQTVISIMTAIIISIDICRHYITFLPLPPRLDLCIVDCLIGSMFALFVSIIPLSLFLLASLT